MGPDTSSGTTTQTPIASIPVPSPNTQQATAQGGLDVIGSLLQTRNSLDTEISKATAKALVPIAGAGGTTSPGLMMTPVPGFQPTPLINRPVVGARANRDQGIANTIIAAANVVGKYETQAKQEKQRVLAVDLERVLQSQQGISEAQQILADDPNNAAAKASLAKNQGIIDAMLKDPKKRKAIGKALDINFTDPSQNNTYEHGAFKQAVQSYSQQLQKAMPANMQVDPQAIARLQSLQAQQKSVDDMIKAVAPATIRAQGAADVESSKERSAFAREVAKLQEDATKAAAEIQARYKTAMDVAKTHEQGALERAQFNAQQAASRMTTGIRLREQLRQARGFSPDKNTAAMQRSYQLASANNLKAANQIAMLEGIRDKMTKGEKKAQPDVVSGYDSSIQFWQKTLKDTQDIMSSIEPQLKAKGVSYGNTPDSSESTDSKTTTDTKGTTTGTVSVGDTGDSDSDPDDSENDPDNY